MTIELISIQAGRIKAFGAEIEDPVSAEAALLAAQIVTLACAITKAFDKSDGEAVCEGRERIRTLCRRFDRIARGSIGRGGDGEG